MSDIQDANGSERTQRPPVVSGSPVEIASGVFVIPDEGVELVPNVGVIVGDRAALVVDAGLGARSGGTVRAIAEDLAGGKPLFLTVTHFHPEHSFGAQAFADATIVYNRAQREEFRQKAGAYQGMFSGIDPAIAEELADVEFVDPHVVYDGEAELDLGGRTVQLLTWGPAHTREDQGVYLPEEKILFIGDLIECRSFPILSFFPPHEMEVDARRWIAVLDRIREMDVETVVPGHGEVGDPGIVGPSYEYLNLVVSETNRLADQGEDPEKIPEIVVPELISRYPEWDAPPDWVLAAGVMSVLHNRDGEAV